MGNFVIIALFTSVFLFGSIFTDIIIEKKFSLMAENIEAIETEKELEEITRNWEKLSEASEIIIDHGDLEEVSRHLWAMKEELKYDYDEFMESKVLVIQMLEHIRDRNTLGIINIL